MVNVGLLKLAADRIPQEGQGLPTSVVRLKCPHALSDASSEQNHSALPDEVKNFL